MESAWFLVFIAILILFQTQKEQSLITRILQIKNHKGGTEMLELAKNFIGQECIVYLFNSQVIGTIKEVSDKAILLEQKNVTEVLNLDYVMRIREYPRSKAGKKKKLVLD